MTSKVDLVILTRNVGPLHPDVEQGFRQQRGVQLVVHRVAGSTCAGDRCRWDAIARARNEGKLCGTAPWLMFLDDDVVLDPQCIAMLVEGLGRRPVYAALAADYLGEQRIGEIARHVSMGATLFRREALEQLRFTWRDDKCECQCCCDDLRQQHWGIDYCRSACARHLTRDEVGRHSSESVAAYDPSQDDGVNRHDHPAPSCVPDSRRTEAPPQVLSAFDRRHLTLFHTRFLASLRATGNYELVIPVAVGLNPSERRWLERVPGVRPIFRSESGQHVARRRLSEFAAITRALPSATPLAYWDAGDVLFQGSLQPLWELLRMNPGKLFAAREPSGHPNNAAVVAWTKSIVNPAARRDAQQAVFHRPFLNSGFLAGDASGMGKYFQTVADWYDLPRLAGTLDWGDQLALNVYCHSHPEAWQELREGWNYCLWGRDPKTYYRREDGQYIDARGLPIHVVHGNAGTLNSKRFCRKPA